MNLFIDSAQFVLFYYSAEKCDSSQLRPCGLMEKASVSGAGDCRFESCHGRHFYLQIYIIYISMQIQKNH